MIPWVLALFIVIPCLLAGYYVARARPKPPPKCEICRDGEELVETPIVGRRGFQLALRCPDCGAYYSAKISAMSLKHLPEPEYRRNFEAHSPKS